jgi:hypothetical protein
VQEAKNFVIECVALHARNLIGFLSPRSPQPDDLLATHYVVGFAPNATEQAAFSQIWRRANKEIAHLTTERVTDAEHASGTVSKAWPLKDLVPVIECSRRFAEQMLASAHITTASERANWEAVRDALDRIAAPSNTQPAPVPTGLAPALAETSPTTKSKF